MPAKLKYILAAVISAVIVGAIIISCTSKPNYEVWQHNADGQLEKVDYSESVEEILQNNP